MACYMLNCLYNMQSTLAMYEYMDDRMERLQAQSDAQIGLRCIDKFGTEFPILKLGNFLQIR